MTNQEKIKRVVRLLKDNGQHKIAKEYVKSRLSRKDNKVWFIRNIARDYEAFVAENSYKYQLNECYYAAQLQLSILKQHKQEITDRFVRFLKDCNRYEDFLGHIDFGFIYRTRRVACNEKNEELYKNRNKFTNEELFNELIAATIPSEYVMDAFLWNTSVKGYFDIDVRWKSQLYSLCDEIIERL